MRESEISREIVKLLRDQLGGSVWSTEQGYRKERGGTRTTPGYPDLIVIFPTAWAFVELKTAKGKLTDSQKVFRDTCLDAEIPWELWRSVYDAWDWCIRVGLISEI